MSGLIRRQQILAAAAAAVGLAGGAALAVLVLAGRISVAPAGVLLAIVIAASAAALLWLYRISVEIRSVTSRISSALQGTGARGADEPLEADGALELGEVAPAVEALSRKLSDSIESREQLDRLLASMSEALLVTDADGRIRRTNAAARTMLQREDSELIDRSVHAFLVDEAPRRTQDQHPTRPREGKFVRRDGSRICVSYTAAAIPNERGAVQSVVYTAQNIDDRKKVEQRIRYLARTDALTKIPNRMQFQHLLQQSIARTRKANRYLALLYLDLDRFKDINDTFGHAAGDSSLEIFSRRILAAIPESATPGRLAGDEFAVLLGGFARMEDVVETVTEVSRKLLKSVGRPYQVQSEEIFMTTSVGIALYPRDADNVVDLLRNADAALYQAKKAGGNCFEFYTAEMNTAAEERLKMKSKLRRAFERDELRLHYQPKYSLSSGRIEGAEALVRWDLPDRGLVFPADFIPLAEETNLILQIGDWVLNRVCSDYRRWQRVIPSPCRVSMNLSLKQLQQQRFLDTVRETFRGHGVAPTCLELEITETTLMEDTDRTIRILDALYGMGLHLAIDDFGTGYSSLSALQQFPISTLKIDRSFVRDIASDADDAAIVRTIIQMAQSLKLDVVAEGVESQEQLDLLKKLGCQYAQGHLFGDPVTGDEFCEMLLADAEGTGSYRALFA